MYTLVTDKDFGDINYPDIMLHFLQLTKAFRYNTLLYKVHRILRAMVGKDELEYGMKKDCLLYILHHILNIWILTK